MDFFNAYNEWCTAINNKNSWYSGNGKLLRLQLVDACCKLLVDNGIKISKNDLIEFNNGKIPPKLWEIINKKYLAEYEAIKKPYQALADYDMEVLLAKIESAKANLFNYNESVTHSHWFSDEYKLYYIADWFTYNDFGSRVERFNKVKNSLVKARFNVKIAVAKLVDGRKQFGNPNEVCYKAIYVNCSNPQEHFACYNDIHKTHNWLIEKVGLDDFIKLYYEPNWVTSCAWDNYFHHLFGETIANYVINDDYVYTLD